MTENQAVARFRQGHRVPRNIYDGDEPLFVAVSGEKAAEYVALLNAISPSEQSGKEAVPAFRCWAFPIEGLNPSLTADPGVAAIWREEYPGTVIEMAPVTTPTAVSASDVEVEANTPGLRHFPDSELGDLDLARQLDTAEEALRVIAGHAICEVGESAHDISLIVDGCREVARSTLAELGRPLSRPLPKPLVEAIREMAALAHPRVSPPPLLDAEWEALDIAMAPRDGTMVQLLIEFDEDDQTGSWAPLADENPCWTIGFNSRDMNGEDVWQFVGWCWTQDCFVDRKAPEDGKVLGWCPLARSTTPQPLEVRHV